MSKLSSIAAALLLAAPLPAQTIDVNQPLHQNQAYIDAQVQFETYGPLAAQSFVPHASDIVGGGFFWHQSNVNGPYGMLIPEGRVEISLWATLPIFTWHVPTPVLLAQSTVAFALGVGEDAWLDAFWNPVTVTPGSTYFLSIRAVEVALLLPDGQLIGATGAGPGFKTTDYTDGSAYINGIFMGPGNPPAGGFYDLTFRTWTTAPEPSTWALMASGLVALGVIARRRQRPTC